VKVADHGSRRLYLGTGSRALIRYSPAARASTSRISICSAPRSYLWAIANGGHKSPWRHAPNKHMSSDQEETVPIHMMPASRSIRARTAQRNANEVGPPLLRKGKGAHDVFLPATVCSIMSKKVAQHRRSNLGRMCSSGPNLCYKRKKTHVREKGREDADHSDGSAVHTRTALIIMTLSFWISSYLLCMTNVFFTSKQPSCEMFFFLRNPAVKC
jgi:hypothetical protein